MVPAAAASAQTQYISRTTDFLVSKIVCVHLVVSSHRKYINVFFNSLLLLLLNSVLFVHSWSLVYILFPIPLRHMVCVCVCVCVGRGAISDDNGVLREQLFMWVVFSTIQEDGKI